MGYGWVKDAEIYIDPQIAGEVIESIRLRTGDVTPDLLIEDSRPDGAPLHSCFEWDDEAAAIEYRREQARTVIRSILVVGESEQQQESTTIRVLRNHDHGGRRPKKLADFLSAPNRRYAIRAALSAIITIREKLSEIDGLEEAVACLIDVENELTDSLTVRKNRVA